MTQFARYFTLHEAETILPVVSRKMEVIRALKRQTDDKIARWEAPLSPESVQSPVEEVLMKSQINFIVSQINREIEALHGLGCLMKDIDRGLVDFPTRMEGRECFLCWRFGEKRIGFWHGTAEGFSNRKPIVRTVIHQ